MKINKNIHYTIFLRNQYFYLAIIEIDQNECKDIILFQINASLFIK